MFYLSKTIQKLTLGLLLIPTFPHITLAEIEEKIFLQYYFYKKWDDSEHFMQPFPKLEFSNLEDCESHLFDIYRSEKNKEINRELYLGVDHMYEQPYLSMDRTDEVVTVYFCQIFETNF